MSSAMQKIERKRTTMRRLLQAGIVALISAASLSSFTLVASSVSPATSVTTSGATFDSAAVDIWAPFGGEADWTLLDESFDTGEQSDSGTVSIPGAGGVTGTFNADGCVSDLLDCFSSPGDYFSLVINSANIGAGASFSGKGRVGFFGEVDSLTGSASVRYPISTSMNYPTAESFMPGNDITLGGSWTTAAGATINAGETRGDVQLDGAFGLGSSASVCAYVPGAECGALYPTFDWESGQTTLFSVGAFDSVPTIPPGLVGLGGTMRALSVTPTTLTTGPGGSVSVQGSHDFSDIIFDLDKILQTIAVPSSAKVPALENSVDLTGQGIPLTAGYNVFDADAHVVLGADQTLTFKDPNVRVRYSFSRPMAGFSGPYLDKAADNSWVDATLGDDIGVTFPEEETQPVTVTPTASLSGTLHNRTRLETDGFIQMNAGKFKLAVPGFQVFPAVGGFDTGLDYPEPILETHMHDLEVCDPIFGTGCETICSSCVPHIHDLGVTLRDIRVPSFGPWEFPGFSVDLGPLWGPENHANSTTNDGLADGDMPVTNFQTSTLASFVLNPQNNPVPDAGGPYSVDEGSYVTLDASGSTDADGDEMTYAWDFENNGSVDATGVTASYYGVDGPSGHSVRLVVCDTNGNCVPTLTTVIVHNVAPTATLNVPTIIGQSNPLILSLTGANDASAPDVAAGFTYAFDCQDGNGYGAFSTSNTVTCTGTVDGVHTVKGTIKDKDGGTTEYTGSVMLDRTPPEAYNEFDTASKDVRVFARDGLSGVPSTPMPLYAVASVSWGDGDGTAAELRTYRIADGAGNVTVLTEKVKKSGTEIKVEVVSLRYNGGVVIPSPKNLKYFEWSLGANGALKMLNQKMTVSSGPLKRDVQAKYDASTNATTIKDGTAKPVMRPGMTLLRLLSAEGGLRIEY